MLDRALPSGRESVWTALEHIVGKWFESEHSPLSNAPEWTRTTTEKILHKALNVIQPV
jgi:hypothetical protein